MKNYNLWPSQCCASISNALNAIISTALGAIICHPLRAATREGTDQVLMHCMTLIFKTYCKIMDLLFYNTMKNNILYLNHHYT